MYRIPAFHTKSELVKKSILEMKLFDETEQDYQIDHRSEMSV